MPVPTTLSALAALAVLLRRGDVYRTADRMRVEEDDDPAGSKANHARPA